MDSKKIQLPEPGSRRLLRPLGWMGLIFGTPIATVAIHLQMEQSYPSVGDQTGFLLLVVWAVAHFCYMTILHSSLETKIADLVAAEEGKHDSGANKTAGAISLAVVSGMTLILFLLIFNFYAHERAARTASPNDKGAKVQSNIDETNASQHALNSLATQLETPIKDQSTADESPSSDAEKSSFLKTSGGFLGTFGDFFGGIVNPLLTAGTLVALAITILLQRTQLNVAERNTKKNSTLMEKQTFETTFFNMLNLHNSTVQDLKFDSSTVDIPVWFNDPDYPLEPDDSDEIENADIEEPNATEDDIYENLNEIEDDIGEELDAIDIDEEYGGGTYDYFGEPDYLQTPIKLLPAEGRQVFARVLELMDSDEHASTPSAVYYRIQKHHNYVLGHYFRTLYQVLELVDEYSGNTDHESATRYSSIIRAQLSANELIVLFYNCSYSLVDSGQFRKLLKRYEILEHMPLHLVKGTGVLTTPGYGFDLGKHVRQYLKAPEDSHEKHSKAGAFGENPTMHKYMQHFPIYIS